MGENEADVNDRWKAITREILLDIYGSSLKNYSALGKRGANPKIYPPLFKGLFGNFNTLTFPLPFSPKSAVSIILIHKNERGINSFCYIL